MPTTVSYSWKVDEERLFGRQAAMYSKTLGYTVNYKCTMFTFTISGRGTYTRSAGSAYEFGTTGNIDAANIQKRATEYRAVAKSLAECVTDIEQQGKSLDDAWEGTAALKVGSEIDELVTTLTQLAQDIDTAAACDEAFLKACAEFRNKWPVFHRKSNTVYR